LPVLIDTNIAIYLRDGDPEIRQRIDELGQLLSASMMSLVELEAGVFRLPALARYRRSALDMLLSSMIVLPLDHAVVTAYGQIVAQAGFSRTRVIDRLIAATALVHDLTLITINAADFRDIPDLRLEAWPTPTQ
jgi:predicted nucleic acid-binding protein